MTINEDKDSFMERYFGYDWPLDFLFYGLCLFILVVGVTAILGSIVLFRLLLKG